MCIGFSVIGNIWSIFIKMLPDSIIPLVGPLKKDYMAETGNAGLGIKGNQNEDVQNRKNNPLKQNSNGNLKNTGY